MYTIYHKTPAGKGQCCSLPYLASAVRQIKDCHSSFNTEIKVVSHVYDDKGIVIFKVYNNVLDGPVSNRFPSTVTEMA